MKMNARQAEFCTVSSAVSIIEPVVRVADEKEYIATDPKIGAEQYMLDFFYKRRYLDPLRPPAEMYEKIALEFFTVEDEQKALKSLLGSQVVEDKELLRFLSISQPDQARFMLWQYAETNRLHDLSDFANQEANIYQDMATKLSMDPKFGMWTDRRIELFWDDITHSPEYPGMMRFGLFVVDLKKFKRINMKFTYVEANKIVKAFGYYVKERIERRGDINPKWSCGKEQRISEILRLVVVKVMGDELAVLIPNLGSLKLLKQLEAEMVEALAKIVVPLISRRGKQSNIPIEFYYASKLLPKNCSLSMEIHDLLNKKIHRMKLKNKVCCTKCGR